MLKSALPLILAAVLGVAPLSAAQLVQIETGTRLAADQLGLALSRGTVLARLEAGDTLALLTGELSASMPATLYLAASTEFLSVAVLRGQVALDGQSGMPGTVLVRGIAGTRTERFAFDVAELLGAMPAGVLDATETAALDELKAGQARRLFWGSLQRTGFDVQSPSGAPMLEAVRRDYLLRPVVMEIRAAAGSDREQLARTAGHRFLSGLAARDAAAVEALLSPGLFSGDGRGHLGWLEARAAFARELVSGPLPDAMSEARLGEGGLAEGFAVKVNGKSWRLQMQPLDTMVFVTALEPVVEAVP